MGEWQQSKFNFKHYFAGEEESQSVLRKKYKG